MIFIKFDMQDFPVSDADAGMTALVALVAIMSAKEL
jgi:hypothetical protein